MFDIRGTAGRPPIEMRDRTGAFICQSASAFGPAGDFAARAVRR